MYLIMKNIYRSTGRFELQAQDGVYKLVCHDAQEDDSATYRCVVTNDVGVAQTSCQVSQRDLISSSICSTIFVVYCLV